MDAEDKENKRRKPGRSAWWWVLMVFVVGLNLLIWRSRQPAGARIPYSSFVGQVQQGNVDRVTIEGNTITGALKQAVSPSTLLPPALVRSSGASMAAGPITIFNATFPEAVGDDSLLPRLAERGVVVDVRPASQPWLALVLVNGIPLAIILVVTLVARDGQARDRNEIMSFLRSRARRSTEARTSLTFSDVAGAEEAKQSLQEVVHFLRMPSRYHQMGAHIPRGILLVGPPGTGKTLMARAVAGEASVPFFNINASEFVELFVGVGASRVRDLFERAKRVAPSVVFIDELDAIGRRRGAGLGSVNEEREQALNQLLVEMDGFDDRAEVIVMAATNRPDVLDSALLRPGRFDQQINVGLPDRHGREAILRIHTQHLKLAPDVDLASLARRTVGFSGADLANLANEGALFAVRRDHTAVYQEDLDQALDRIMLGGERPLAMSRDDQRIIAYHESGHALVAWLTPGADAVHKVTIIPHGQALGVTQQMPGEDQYNYGRNYLLARVRVMLGGRAAEEIALADITTGSEKDLQEASSLARRMVTQWGMGDLGLATFGAEGDQGMAGEMMPGRNFSEETAARIDRNLQSLLDAQYHVVKDLLTGARVQLDMLATTLLEEEALSHKDLESLLGPPAGPMLTQTTGADQPGDILRNTAATGIEARRG